MLKICSIILFYFLRISSTYGQTNEENDCECVPYYLCINGTINTNRENIFSLRMGDGCDNYFDICCKKKDVIILNDRLQSPKPSTRVDCGYRNPDGVDFGISGAFDNEAEFGEFPWIVAILHRESKEKNYILRCGGSLIHPQVVLTAAHCIVGSRSLMVRAGEWDSKTTNEIYQHQDRKVTSVVIHGSYNNMTLYNDIALIFLETPFNKSQHINVACLVPENSVVLSNECFVSGWGKDKFNGVAYQNILKKIKLPMVERDDCLDAFQRTRLGRRFRLGGSFICAGGEKGKDACTGDGGGPLVCPIQGQEDRYQQVGIVAWGIGCGTEGVPGAYADVAYFRGWIDKQMRKNRFSSDTYEF